MTLDQYIAVKKQQLETKLEIVRREYKTRCNDNMPTPNSFKDWDEFFACYMWIE